MLSSSGRLHAAASESSSVVSPTTYLQRSAAAGDGCGVRTALADGADPGQVDADGLTPMHLAARNASANALAALVEAGVPTDTATRQGRRALHLACGSGAWACVKRLLYYDADAHAATADGRRPLHYCATGEARILAAASRLSRDAQPRELTHVSCGRDGRHEGSKQREHERKVSASFATQVLDCRAGARQCVALLVRAGADVAAVDEIRRTALHSAAQAGALGIGGAVLEHAAHVGPATNSPAALRRGAARRLALLRAKDLYGWTARQLAEGNAHLDFVAMLDRVERQSVTDKGGDDSFSDEHQALDGNEHAALKRALHNVQARREDISARLRAVRERRQILQERLVSVRGQLSAALYALYMLKFRSSRHGSSSTEHDAPHHIPKSGASVLSILSLEIPRRGMARSASYTTKMGGRTGKEGAATVLVEPMFGRAGVAALH